MESLSNVDAKFEFSDFKHRIHIKDKNGIYFLQPFIDKKNKLFELENVSIVFQSNDLIIVNNYFILRLWREDL